MLVDFKPHQQMYLLFEALFSSPFRWLLSRLSQTTSVGASSGDKNQSTKDLIKNKCQRQYIKDIPSGSLGVSCCTGVEMETYYLFWFFSSKS